MTLVGPGSPRPRTYLMCPPDHFTVAYAINPWMDPTVPVDTALAGKQWQRLQETLVDLGHTVHVLAPRAGLPDMVYAANGAFTVGGVAYGARFRHGQRAAEAAAHEEWYRGAGWRFVPARHVNEGEGDFTLAGDVILAGYGFRTDPAAHAEVAAVLGRPVVSLRLVDPRLYHLDAALAVLDDGSGGAGAGTPRRAPRVAYFPGAFAPQAQEVLRRRFPDALIADEADALAFGLNLVSDGRHVVLNAEATGMAAKLAAAGYQPVPVELSELKKGGGSARCCVAEFRR